MSLATSQKTITGCSVRLDIKLDAALHAFWLSFKICCNNLSS